MLSRKILISAFILFSASSVGQPLAATDILIDEFTIILATKKGDEEREAPLYQLLNKAEKFRENNSDLAEAWTNTARIRFWYADTQSMRRGLSQMKIARDELLQAIALNPKAQDGYAQAYLGFRRFRTGINITNKQSTLHPLTPCQHPSNPSIYIG